jgi:hypothetical protein
LVFRPQYNAAQPRSVPALNVSGKPEEVRGARRDSGGTGLPVAYPFPNIKETARNVCPTFVS